MAEKFTAVQLDTAAQRMYENLISLYSLKGTQHIVVQMDLLVAQERRRRAKLEKK